LRSNLCGVLRVLGALVWSADPSEWGQNGAYQVGTAQSGCT